MALTNLTDEETEVVYQCLRCVATGELVPHDSEFQTRFGIEPEDVQAIVRSLPDISESVENVILAINNSMNELLECYGEPKWHSHISVSKAELSRIFAKWRGKTPDSYFEGMA
jgi:hypothetical protein